MLNYTSCKSWPCSGQLCSFVAKSCDFIGLFSALWKFYVDITVVHYDTFRVIWPCASGWCVYVNYLIYIGPGICYVGMCLT